MAGTLMQRFREQSNPGGEAALLWLGQMGLLIRIGKTVLCVDYYASDAENRRVPPPIPAEEMGGVDLFLGTHDHLDHIDLEMDGGIGAGNVAEVIDAGVNVVVAGSAVFGGDIAMNTREICAMFDSSETKQAQINNDN